MKQKGKVKEIFGLAGKNKKTLLVSTLVDIVFIIAALLVYYFFFTRMMPSLLEVADIASNDMNAAIESLSAQNPTAISEIMPVLRSHYIFIITNLILMFVSFLALCIATQSISWYKPHILFKKIKFWAYAKPFAIISTAYFVIFIVSAPALFNLLYLFSRILGTPVRPVFAPIMTFIFFLVSYLTITTYSLIGTKNIIKQSFKKAFSLYFLRFLISALAVFMISFILFKIITFITNPIIQFLIMLLIFPFITIAKLWLLEQ